MKRLFCLILAALLLAGCSAKEEAAEATTLSTESTVPVQTEPVTEATEPPTEVTEEPTEPPEEHYLFTFAGDCTFGSLEEHIRSEYGFTMTVGDDYGFPFRNVAEYFLEDDFSMVNLEGVLADQSTAVVKKHVFRGPTHLVNILTENSVEAVTIANNHTMDHGQAGYDSTVATLTDAGVTFAEQDGSFIYTTESGLTLGVYSVSLDNLNIDQITAAIAVLDADPKVDIVILAAHWGIENTFKPNEQQQSVGHAAIDAGADIVFGTHPHVLQPIEEYNGGIIYYSLGNFSFGGNGSPKDYDTAFVQQEVIREVDGTVHLGELTIIPCSISTNPHQNDFRPTPYAADSKEYARIMSKLDGSYTGGNLPYD